VEVNGSPPMGKIASLTVTRTKNGGLEPLAFSHQKFHSIGIST
jgi:hypothetical protein